MKIIKCVKIKETIMIFLSASTCITAPLASEEKITQESQIATVYQVKASNKYKIAHIYLITQEGRVLRTSTSYEDMKKNYWKAKDPIVLRFSAEDAAELEQEHATEDFSVTVINNRNKHKDYFKFAGWSLSNKLQKITSLFHQKCQKEDVEDRVTIGLDNGGIWKVEYFDEKAHAKAWKAQQKVLFLINNYCFEQAPPVGEYATHWEYDIINLSSKTPFAGEPAKLVTPPSPDTK
jgi:hypothetical protein